jgi:hypothetical protein
MTICLGLGGVDADHAAQHGHVGLVAAEESQERPGVVGDAQADAQVLSFIHRGQHLLRLGHDGLDELELDLDEQARQLHRRAREVMGADLVPRIGGL